MRSFERPYSVRGLASGDSALIVDSRGGTKIATLDTWTIGSWPAAVAAPTTVRAPTVFCSSSDPSPRPVMPIPAAAWIVAPQPSAAGPTTPASTMSPTTSSTSSGSTPRRASTVRALSGLRTRRRTSWPRARRAGTV